MTRTFRVIHNKLVIDGAHSSVQPVESIITAASFGLVNDEHTSVIFYDEGNSAVAMRRSVVCVDLVDNAAQ